MNSAELDATLPWIEHPETIVFYHGLGANAKIWRSWVPMLADRFRMLSFDPAADGAAVPKAGRGRATV